MATGRFHINMAQSQPTPIVSASSVRLCEGALYKRGKVNKSWKSRWFVMNMNFELNYFESKGKSEETFIVNRNVLGTIDLLQVEKIEVSLIGDISHDQIPKYIKVLANDKDDRSFLIHLVTNNRTYKLSANDSASFLKWLEFFHEYLYGGVLFESMLEKKGEVNKSFKKRYFVLNKFKQLKYYNNDDREILHGFIDLNDNTIELKLPQQDYYFGQDNYIELISEKRKWILKVEQADLFQEWIAYLSNLDEMEDVIASKVTTFIMNEKKEDDKKYVIQIERKDGDIFKEWIKAQNDIKLGKQPAIIKNNGYILNNPGKYRRQMSTVHDIQNLLDIRTSSRIRHRAFGVDSADYTDNEMSDDSDDEDDDTPSATNGHNNGNNNNDPQQQDFLNIISEYKDSSISNVKEKEYKFKSIDIENDEITCIDNSNGIIKDIKFDIKELESQKLMKMRQIIEKGQTEKIDVTIIVVEMKGKEENDIITRVQEAKLEPQEWV